MVAVTFGLARYGYGLLLPEMQSDLGITPHGAGLIASAAYVSYLAANLAVIWLTVRLGPRWPIGLAAAFAAAGMGVVATADAATGATVGVLVAGAAAGLAFPPYADIVAQQVPGERQAPAWSAISSTGWGVAIAGPVAIGFGDDWRLAWLVFVVLAVGAGIVATLVAPPRAERTDRARLPQLSWTWFVCPKSRPLLLPSVLVGAYYCAVIATQGIWSAEVFAERPSAGLSAVNTALTIGTIAGPAAAGVAIHRAGYTSTLLAAAAVVVVAISFCPPTARRREILATHSEVCRAKPAKA